MVQSKWEKIFPIFDTLHHHQLINHLELCFHLIKELSKYIKNFYANYHLINQIFNLMNLKKIGQNDGN